MHLTNLATRVFDPQGVADAQLTLRTETETFIATLFVAVLPFMKRSAEAEAFNRPISFVRPRRAKMHRRKRSSVIVEDRCDRRVRRRCLRR
ncbi:MAG: hypothetical protein JOZ01_04085 [Candidatus Eremiobacteraeota bacterium]|nr:hypothetical protein [Candidatus Eremiobacteraeota bacterium]